MLVYEDNFGFSNISEPEERAIVPKASRPSARPADFHGLRQYVALFAPRGAALSTLYPPFDGSVRGSRGAARCTGGRSS